MANPKGNPNLKGGSRKGKPNKTTALLKDAILLAAEQAGGDDGLVGYLTQQAKKNPTAFMPLLGKVLPLQIASVNAAGHDAPFRIVLEGVAPK